MNSDSRKQTIKLFLSKGYQLDEKALNFIIENPNKEGEIIDFLKKTQPKTSTLAYGDIVKIFETEEVKLEILKSPQIIEKPYSPNTILSYLNARYDFIKNILQKRIELTNLTSINKIGRAKQFSLIVLIREIDHVNKSLVVDDRTGSTKLFVEDAEKIQYLIKDEAVGLVCKQDDNKITASKILHPDTLIKREITKTKNTITCIFLSDFNLDHNINQQFYENYKKWCKELDGESTWVFILGGISKDVKHNEEFIKYLPKQSKKVIFENSILHEHENPISIGDPSFIRLGGITLFLSQGRFLKKYESIFTSKLEEMLVNLIKTRHLNPTFDANNHLYKSDPYTLDIIPDIIAVGSSGIPKSLNYKGITVLTTGSFLTQPIFWSINLQTRETLKIDFT